MLAETEHRIGLLAVENHLLTRDQFAQAVAAKDDRPIEEVLVDLGFLSPGQIEELTRQAVRCERAQIQRGTKERRCVETVADAVGEIGRLDQRLGRRLGRHPDQRYR